MPKRAKSSPRYIDAAHAKQIMVEAIAAGATISSALRQADRSQSWYELARREDPEFVEAINNARAKNAMDGIEASSQMGNFPDFCAAYLHQRIWPHQQNMIDVVEGRTPAWIHPSMTYEPGSQGERRVLINIPPNHAKTMTLSINYVTYRVIANPNISVLLVSKTQEMAKKILYGVKQRLTHPRYAKLQARFAPPDGFKAASDMWTQNRIYLGGEARDSGEKDPTVEAVGIGGQIYGARANLILLDDTVTLSNASEYEKQDDWIRQEVASRLGPGGQIIVVGTRVASMDLYRWLRDPETYTDGVVPWTYLSMPAVLEYAQDKPDWVTLWPRSDEPFVEDDPEIEPGVFPRWTGERLAQVRNEVGPKRWSMVYQNSDVAEDAAFDVICVRGSVEGQRYPGPLVERDGWHVLIGVDPAVAGQAAIVSYAVHRATGERKVLDVRTLLSPAPSLLRSTLTDMVEEHSPHEVIIEQNAFQQALVKDEVLGQFLANRGIVLRPHQTGANKHDPDFGVASMSSLFGTRTQGQVGAPSKHKSDNLLSLPRANDSQGVKILMEELVSWDPTVPVKRRRQDTVMALWFCELRARELIVRPGNGSGFHVRHNKFISDRRRSQQMVINLNDYMDEQKQTANWM